MKNVIVYSSPLWTSCTEVKDYLDSKNISYEDYDISRDRDRAVEMIQKSAQQGVPVVDIGGDIVLGFDKESINDLLG